jgi:hypothetical protein
VIAKSIDLADGRHLADGSRIVMDENGRKSIQSAPKNAKPRKGKSCLLSETDRAEIQSEVSRVLAFNDAYSRPLQTKDWQNCFSSVQSSDCLDLNRRWKRLENATAEELTLDRLAAPVFDVEIDEARLELLAERKAECLAWIDAAASIDKGRKAQSTRAKWISHLDAVCDGTAGNGMDKRERRRQRADFRAYLETGRLACAARRLTHSTYLPAQIALESLTLS